MFRPSHDRGPIFSRDSAFKPLISSLSYTQLASLVEDQIAPFPPELAAGSRSEGFARGLLADRDLRIHTLKACLDDHLRRRGA